MVRDFCCCHASATVLDEASLELLFVVRPGWQNFAPGDRCLLALRNDGVHHRNRIHPMILIRQQFYQFGLWAEHHSFPFKASRRQHAWSISILAGRDLCTVPGGTDLKKLWVCLERITVYIVGAWDALKHVLFLWQHTMLDYVVVLWQLLKLLLLVLIR